MVIKERILYKAGASLEIFGMDDIIFKEGSAHKFYCQIIEVVGWSVAFIKNHVSAFKLCDFCTVRKEKFFRDQHEFVLLVIRYCNLIYFI